MPPTYPDLTDRDTWTDDDLDQLRIAVLTEQERRRTIATAPEQAEALATIYAAAIGRLDGDEWVEPTAAHDAYQIDAEVTHAGQTWTSTAAGNVWEPGVFGWTVKPA